MLIKVLRAKIHRATITEACVDYVGSITIDRELMDACGMVAGECVLVADLADGARFDTYVMEGERGSGTICINGAAARLVRVGDPAPDMTLPDDSGTQTSLSSLWSERPLVLLFIRHLG